MAARVTAAEAEAAKAFLEFVDFMGVNTQRERDSRLVDKHLAAVRRRRPSAALA